MKTLQLLLLSFLVCFIVKSETGDGEVSESRDGDGEGEEEDDGSSTIRDSDPGAAEGLTAELMKQILMQVDGDNFKVVKISAEEPQNEESNIPADEETSPADDSSSHTNDYALKDDGGHFAVSELSDADHYETLLQVPERLEEFQLARVAHEKDQGSTGEPGEYDVNDSYGDPEDEVVSESLLETQLKAMDALLNRPSTTPPHLFLRKEAIDEAIKGLQSATDNADAQLLYAKCLLFGKFSVGRDPYAAFQVFKAVADNWGRAEAHFYLGFFYSTGYMDIVAKDDMLALIHYTFGAVGNNVLALQALGYRYNSGIGVGDKCELSLFYYRKAADLEAKQFKDGVRSAVRPTPLKISVVEEAGGLYGPGSTNSELLELGGDDISIDDLIQYHQHNADRGDAHSQVILGQLYYFGRHTLPRSYERALKNFRAAASILPPTPPQRLSSAAQSEGQMRAGAQAVTFLGSMYWHGHGVPQNNATAARLFKQAVEYGNSDALNNLGVMYHNGIVVKMDVTQAFKYFKKAADKKNADAMVNLGRIYLGLANPDFDSAMKRLDEATKRGSLVSLYDLGKLHLGQGPVVHSCESSQLYLKTFVERADFDRAFLEAGYEQYEKKEYEAAYLEYLIASELGYDAAHMNVAWMLEKGMVPSVGQDRNETFSKAAVYYQRAAALGNADARIKVGDLLYFGLGLSQDAKKSASFYRAAAEDDRSAIGWFNLGYMYQEGIGVKQDFHLAKRYFDRALSSNPNAALPVSLAHIYLRIKYFFHWIRHGGSFYLDSLPNELKGKGESRSDGEEGHDSHDDFDSDDGLQAAIKRAQEEGVKQKQDQDLFGREEGNEDFAADWDEYYNNLPDDDYSDVTLLLFLTVAAAALIWARQQPQRNAPPPPPVQPLQPLEQEGEPPEQERQGQQGDVDEIQADDNPNPTDRNQ